MDGNETTKFSPMRFCEIGAVLVSVILALVGLVNRVGYHEDDDDARRQLDSDYGYIRC
jgi:hypothetical protein